MTVCPSVFQTVESEGGRRLLGVGTWHSDEDLKGGKLWREIKKKELKAEVSGRVKKKKKKKDGLTQQLGL